MRSASIALLAAVSSAALATAANAQPQVQGSGAELEEVIVTAQKRAENVQSVPATVSVVDAAVLEARGVTDLRGVTAFVPMVNLNQENSVTQVFIRGIGQTSDAETNDPAVATNIDGVYASRFTLSGSLFDVDRVEVLYGPQGTLYGRNAAGGTVNVTTKLPGSEFGGEGRVEYGNFNYRHGFVAANLPVSDKLALRVAVDAAKRDGFMSNGQNDLDSLAGRVTARWTPSDALSVVARAEFQQMGGRGDTLIVRPYLRPSDPWYQPLPNGENYHSDRKVQKYNAEFNYDFGGPLDLRLTYIPAYTYYFYNYAAPIGYPARYTPDAGRPGFPQTGFAATLTSDNRARQQTHELRLSGKSARLDWVVGAFVYDLTAKGQGASFNILNPAVFAGGSSQPYAFRSGGPQNFQRTETDSRAIFGQATFSVTEALRVTGGLRYSDDGRRSIGRAQNLVPIANLALTPVNYNLRLDDDRADWKVGAEFDVSPDSMAYGSIQTGYIGGGFNVTAATATATTFDPETVLAYTVGIKNMLWNRRLRLNAEAFYYDYKGLQVSAYSAATGAALLQNIDKSEIYGAQAETSLRLARGLNIDASLGYLHTEIKKGVLPPAAVYSCGVPGAIPASYCSSKTLIDYSGLSLPNSPKWSASLSITKTWSLVGGGELTANLGGNYQSSAWGLFSHLEGLKRAPYAKADASLTYEAPDGNWSMAAWVKNIGDTATYVTPATTSVYGMNTWFIDAPRTYGIRLGFEF